ncbi:MAG TPA: thioesterase family protein [Thermoanaerobaculia bacterium]|nr:thioesterase family protein [Thermoanaerobaculia bacterium]
MPEPTRVAVELEVRYAETDAMGIVHHANYLVWFEVARTALCRGTGLPYPDIEAMGYLLVVSGAELRYRQGARYGERVSVTTWIERLGSRLMRFAYEVRRGEDLLATDATEHVWVERASRRPCRMPEPLREPFARLAGMREAPL